ncbi:tyrosine-type recombinase/integrase [Mycobacterium avium]|uniref:tyrosine-type recombinase/integrase n=1 Tax=Mycobacterium avium TaxID=1764 RepID=UPI001EEF0C95|nr:tyrosine-type recombinase/integrase [Mycobacterium avium]
MTTDAEFRDQTTLAFAIGAMCAFRVLSVPGAMLPVDTVANPGRTEMARRAIVDDLRVQPLHRGGGWRSFTIVWPDGTVHEPADGFLRQFDGSTTQRTYAYHLVDHLRWCAREGLNLESISVRDLRRYMGAVGAKISGPHGLAWRERPYGNSALQTTAACLKGYYLHHAVLGSCPQLGRELDQTRLPTRADRERSMLGHVTTSVRANPLAPKSIRRRHPKMLPDGARPKLEQVVRTARDRLVVAWLCDGGFRIGELCGLHLMDLHLRDGAECGGCRSPHVHVCDRPANPNGARAKTKLPWTIEDGTVTGGLIKRVSPAMIHTYFDYVTGERARAVVDEHGMLLVQLDGDDIGAAWAPDAARAVLRRAGARAGLGRIRPHMFRHSFATAVLDASGGNLVVTRDAGGWSSTTTVDEVYAHADLHDPVFDAALRKTWGLT